MHRQRLSAVSAAIGERGAARLLDLGCGDGALLMHLAEAPHTEHVVGIDISAHAVASLRARLESAPPQVRQKVRLIHGSFTAFGPILAGFDMAVLLECIEHVDPGALSSVEKAVFRNMRPASVVVTTPNSEFNPLLGVPPHRFRHTDHRFEWDRARFREWADGIGRRNGYRVAVQDIAGAHPTFGGASQMAVFDEATKTGPRQSQPD